MQDENSISLRFQRITAEIMNHCQRIQPNSRRFRSLFGSQYRAHARLGLCSFVQLPRNPMEERVTIYFG